MRAVAILLVTGLAGCAAPQAGAPSLAPRAAEAIDPRAPIADITLAQGPSLQLLNELQALVSQALGGDEAFRSAAATAERLAASAGPPQSESWITAQQALSAAVAARAPVARAMGEIDALAARRIQQLGGVDAGDLAAIRTASARVAEIDAEEAAEIDRIQARLGG